MITYSGALSKRRDISMRIRPLHDRIIVKRTEEEEKTKGGIIIPDTAKEKPVEGKVIAIGEGRIKKDGTKIPLEVKVGDRVLFTKYGGTEVKIDGEEHLMMREDDILAIIA
jgi:chaperonin GroES